jgi:hypothetical protein
MIISVAAISLAPCLDTRTLIKPKSGNPDDRRQNRILLTLSMSTSLLDLQVDKKVMLCFQLVLFATIIVSARCFRFYRRVLHPSRKVIAPSLRCSQIDSIQPCTFTGQSNILVAKPDDVDPFFEKSVILITEYTEEGTVGQVINKPSHWTMGEMGYETGGEFQSNMIYHGGKTGQDTAIMVHKHNLGGLVKHLGKGIYIGGSAVARAKVHMKF